MRRMLAWMRNALIGSTALTIAMLWFWLMLWIWRGFLMWVLHWYHRGFCPSRCL